MFWSDVAHQVIVRAHLDGTGVSVLLDRFSDITHPGMENSSAQ